MNQRPVLYSFRRCPFAIRARMALHTSEIDFEHREILLKDKPPEMLAISPKATVPVLITDNGEVLDESSNIVFWSLGIHDPDRWLGKDQSLIPEIKTLLERNDVAFKPFLDRYKYADRHPEKSPEAHRTACLFYLEELEAKLTANQFLLGDYLTAGDIVVMPFIRQFAFVDKTWFDQTPYPRLKAWLEDRLLSPLFIKTMAKVPLWEFRQK